MIFMYLLPFLSNCFHMQTGGAKEQGSDGGDNNGGDKSDGILGLSEYLASVDEEDSDDDDWDDDD